MILQALTAYYDSLVAQGELERPGWQPVKVSYALQIDREGRLIRVLSLIHSEKRGKKEVMVPQTLYLPMQTKRTVGISGNFLCDNATYMLGMDAKGKPERAKNCFLACKALHEQLLGAVNAPVAQAIIKFFQNWRPESATECAALTPYMQDLLTGANLIFDFEGRFVHEYPEIQQAWDTYSEEDADSASMCCLVTGEHAPIARLHPSIKGVAGGQSTGVSLVSFNAPAYESFGHDGEQGLNAPVSERAAFAYTSALNYMITKEGHHRRIGDATVVYWAANGEAAYADAWSEMIDIGDKELRDFMKTLSAGRKAQWKESEIDPDARFYILGLSPNAARLSVRFFLEDSFGDFARNLQRHHDDMEIVRPSFDQRPSLSFWQMLNETVNPNAKDKTPSPLLSGALLRAVLSDARYPRLLLDQVELRIRAEQNVTRGRAAIIKAYFLQYARKAGKHGEYEEALCVELNENTKYPPYLLGRLFAVLENLQQSANPGINATIRDRYFNSACATPAVTFPLLIKLAQAHLKKLNTGSRIYFDKLIGEIMNQIDQEYPARLSLREQGIFQLGYYHQTQKNYTKREDKNNG